MVNEKIFREYDIRGVVGKDFDAAFARTLGRAYAEIVWSEKFAPLSGTPTVAVGTDCRLSADELSAAFIDGVTSGGVNVLVTGMGPTPQLYYMVLSQKLSGGVQITASHNPSDQNGFKSMVGPHTLSGQDIQLLKTESQRVERGEIKNGRPKGTVQKIDARKLYIDELIQRSKDHMGSRKLRVVVDGGNGVGGLVGPAVLKALGCEVIEIFTDPDGRFPNHHPDPTVMENIVELRRLVVEKKADVGIGWDGDADRIGVINEKGEPIFGDMLLVIYGRYLLKDVAKPTIIGDVKCSEFMFEDLRKRGANAVMSRTGHSLIKAKLKELHAELAGEMSGHMFFSHRYYGFDDALHASARLVEILSHTQEPISKLLDGIPPSFSTPEIRVDCPEEIKFQIAEGAKTLFPEYESITIDGVRVKFPHGWGLVRASNTQPALVMRFEADSQAHLQEYRKLFEERIRKLQSELQR